MGCKPSKPIVDPNVQVIDAPERDLNSQSELSSATIQTRGLEDSITAPMKQTDRISTGSMIVDEPSSPPLDNAENMDELSVSRRLSFDQGSPKTPYPHESTPEVSLTASMHKQDNSIENPENHLGRITDSVNMVPEPGVSMMDEDSVFTFDHSNQQKASFLPVTPPREVSATERALEEAAEMRRFAAEVKTNSNQPPTNRYLSVTKPQPKPAEDDLLADIEDDDDINDILNSLVSDHDLSDGEAKMGNTGTFNDTSIFGTNIDLAETKDLRAEHPRKMSNSRKRQANFDLEAFRSANQRKQQEKTVLPELNEYEEDFGFAPQRAKTDDELMDEIIATDNRMDLNSVQNRDVIKAAVNAVSHDYDDLQNTSDSNESGFTSPPKPHMYEEEYSSNHNYDNDDLDIASLSSDFDPELLV